GVQPEEARQRALVLGREDRAGVSTSTSAGAQDTECLQNAQGLAYRGAGNLEGLGELALGREPVAHRETPLVNGVLNLHDDVFEGAPAFNWGKGRCQFFHAGVLPFGKT